MKYLLLFFILCASQLRAQQMIYTYPAFVSYWNPLTKIPDSVIYTAHPHTKVTGRLPGFHTEAGLANFNVDYKKSGYDKGHFANASDMNGNATDEYNSFSLVNVAPQCPKLNRITWLALENLVRDTAQKYGAVKVKIYWFGVLKKIGVDSVTVPAYCLKEIWYGTHHHDTYRMPNTDSVTNHPYTYYLVRKNELAKQ